MKVFYLLAGFLSLLVGVAGIILPVVPTTPLLLLAGFCFAKSSKRFEVWLRQTKLYQFYVADYAETRAIAKERKQWILLQVYILMGISIYLAPLRPIKLFLVALTLFITYYLFKKIPNKEDN